MKTSEHAQETIRAVRSELRDRLNEKTLADELLEASVIITDERTEMLDALREVSAEITRINQAAGETRFNPAATGMVRAILARRGAVFA